MEEQIIAALLADPDVSALVGNKVYPGRVPQGVLPPAIVFNTVASVPEYADGGEIGLTESSIQIDCWAETYGSAKVISRAVSKLLSGKWFTAGDVEFQFVLQDSARDLSTDSVRVNQADYYYRAMLEFTVWHSPAP